MKTVKIEDTKVITLYVPNDMGKGHEQGFLKMSNTVGQ